MKSNLQSVSLPAVIKGEHYFKDIELEGVVAEYSPDISRLIRVEASPYTEGVEKGANGEKTTVSGQVIFGILYESDYKSKLAYTTFTVPFEVSCEISLSNECYPQIKCDCTYLTCRLLGGRKVSLKAKLDVSVSGTRAEQVTLVSPESDSLETFFKTQSVTMPVPVGQTENTTEIKENIRLEQPVSSVVCASATLSPEKTEVYDTSATLKAEMNVSSLCELENGDYKTFESKFPVEISLTDDKIKSDTLLECNLEHRELSVVADLDEYGENRMLNLSADLKATAVIFQNETVAFPLDAFNKKHTCNCTKNVAAYQVKYPKQGRGMSFERSHSVNGEFDIILSATAFTEITEQKSTENGVFVKGRIKTEILAKSGESVVSKSYTDDFEDNIAYDGDGIPTQINISVYDCKASVYGDNVNIKTTAFASVEGEKRFAEQVLTNVEIEDDKLEIPGGFKFYYPDSGETVWDIAKKYHVDPERLARENAESLTEDGKLSGKRYVKVTV